MIDRVTITGADDSIKPKDLIPLTEEFPFAEWAILASQTNTYEHGGTLRYPSPQWILDFQNKASDGVFTNTALHLCGRWVRDILKGATCGPYELWARGFGRIQLNFHAERCECWPEPFAKVLRQFSKPIIFQLDGADGNKHLDAANEWEVPHCYGLFDVSGGAGILPAEWPQPIYLDCQPGEDGDGEEYWAYHGYAGGLGPDNLAEQIPLILKAAAATEHTREGRIWLDMESRVRSDSDRKFDLDKVRRCLEIAAPYVNTT